MGIDKPAAVSAANCCGDKFLVEGIEYYVDCKIQEKEFARGRGQFAEGSWQRAAGRKQLAESSWQKAVGRKQLAESSWQKAVGRKQLKKNSW